MLSTSPHPPPAPQGNAVDLWKRFSIPVHLLISRISHQFLKKTCNSPLEAYIRSAYKFHSFYGITRVRHWSLNTARRISYPISLRFTVTLWTIRAPNWFFVSGSGRFLIRRSSTECMCACVCVCVCVCHWVWSDETITFYTCNEYAEEVRLWKKEGKNYLLHFALRS